jgi:hypothetical protein
LSIKEIRSLKKTNKNQSKKIYFNNIIIGSNLFSLLIYYKLNRNKNEKTAILINDELETSLDLSFFSLDQGSLEESQNYLNSFFKSINKDLNLFDINKIVKNESKLYSSGTFKKITKGIKSKLSTLENEFISSINKVYFEKNPILNYVSTNSEKFNIIKSIIENISHNKSEESDFLNPKKWTISTKNNEKIQCSNIFLVNHISTINKSLSTDIFSHDIKSKINNLTSLDCLFINIELKTDILMIEHSILYPFTNENEEFFIVSTDCLMNNNFVYFYYFFDSSKISESELNSLISKKLKIMKNKITKQFPNFKKNIIKENIHLKNIPWVSNSDHSLIESINNSSEYLKLIAPTFSWNSTLSVLKDL